MGRSVQANTESRRRGKFVRARITNKLAGEWIHARLHPLASASTHATANELCVSPPPIAEEGLQRAWPQHVPPALQLRHPPDIPAPDLRVHPPRNCLAPTPAARGGGGGRGARRGRAAVRASNGGEEQEGVGDLHERGREGRARDSKREIHNE